MQSLDQFFDEQLLKKLEDFRIVDWGATSDPIPYTLKYFNEWIEKGLHGPLTYLSDHRQQVRSSVKNVFPQFQMGLTFLFDYSKTSYALEKFYESDQSNKLKVASYALGFEGLDYHHIIKDKLIEIGQELKKKDDTLEFALALDVHPILERDLASKCGLGWFGKNSMLINKSHGSFFIIGSLLLSKSYTHESPGLEVDHCGQCLRCIEACPTDAITSERTIDSAKCISTFTIEQFKEVDPPKGMEQGQGEVFGCDICQTICPWNQRVFRIYDRVKEPEQLAPANSIIYEKVLRAPLNQVIINIDSLSNNGFKKLFKGTSFERLGKRGFLKNLKFWEGRGRFNK